MTENYKIAEDVVHYTIDNIVMAGTIVTDDSFLSDLGLDSLDTIELAMDIETELNIYIKDDEFVRCHTVGELIKFIESCLDRQI